MNRATNITGPVNPSSALVPDAGHWAKILDSAEVLQLFRAMDNELFVRFGKDPGAVLISSAAAGEGRTTMALALALLSAAQDAAATVLLVDADYDNAKTASLVQCDRNSPTLFDYFGGAVGFDELLRKTSLPNLQVVGGERRTGSGKWVHSRFETFLEEAVKRYSLVVVDGPAVATSRDAISLGKVVSKVLMVVRYGGPNREQVQAAVAELERVGAEMLGVVMNQRAYPVPQWLYGRR